MPSTPMTPPPFDASLAAQLACPACLGELRLDRSYLICSGCGRAYPINDGIPALVVERAEMPAAVKALDRSEKK